jgi:D-sorbitol dehydrogenase (acceptor)
MSLAGKVCLVVGGASGIGLAIAHAAAADGAVVVIADRDAAAAESSASAISGAIAVGLDITEPNSIDHALAAVIDKTGGIDVLFNCAGVWAMEALLDVTRRSFNHLFSVNVAGLFFVMQAVARSMVAAARPGSIVNIASQAGRRGEADSAVYAATKACVISLTQSAALALIGRGIRVNAIAPGVVDTPMWARVDASFAARDGVAVGDKTASVLRGTPIGRLASPSEIAAAAVFLAGDSASYIVGQTFNVDGGAVLS